MKPIYQSFVEKSIQHVTHQAVDFAVTGGSGNFTASALHPNGKLHKS